MTRSEYQELVEFLGQRFDGVDRRFDAVEDRLTRVEVGVEGNRHQIQVLAEGLSSLDQKLERFREDTAEGFRAVRSEMAGGFASVWFEFGTVRKEMAQGFQAQSKLIKGIGARF
jgi:hypothetical protein